MSYKEEQARKNLEYYQGMSGTMKRPSSMASSTEREAYTAQEVGRGNLPPSELSEDFGGRPQGSSRRAIRMQDEWDKRQAELLNQQQVIQQIERAAKIEQREGWRYTKEQNEYSAQLKLDALNERDAAQESSEVNAIASGLEGIDLKNDPEAGLKIDQLVLENPLGAARDTVAKRLEAARSISGTYGIAATTKADQEAGKVKSAIINKALSEGVTESEIEATRFADPKTAMVDYDYEKIERLAAKRGGERKDKEPEEEYKPISVVEARDRRDVVKAEFDALSSSVEGGELEDDDPDYVKTRARLRKAEAELKVAEGAKRPQAGGAQPEPKELNPRDKSALDWANANPDDPRSSKIKQRLGVD
jgi:hypothetical protein